MRPDDVIAGLPVVVKLICDVPALSVNPAPVNTEAVKLDIVIVDAFKFKAAVDALDAVKLEQLRA